MALITCPECGKQVSDKAEICIHCGYPLAKMQNSQPRENQEYSLILCNSSTSRALCANLIKKYKKVDITTGLKICDSKKEEIIYSNTDYNWLQKIAKEFEDIGCRMKIVPSNQTNTLQERELRCPKCQSSSIATGTRGFKLTTGFIGANKTVNRCSKCGFSWTPQ